MSDHAPYSPSAAYRWLACPGSVPLTIASNLPPEPSSPAAAKGTELHAYAEALLRRKLYLSPGIVHDTRSADAYVKHVRELMSPTSHLYIEDRLEFPGFEGLVYGTADAVIHDPETGHVTVIDYKSGRNPVDPVENPQLLIYGISAFHKLRASSLTVSISQDSQLLPWLVPTGRIFDFIAEVETALKAPPETLNLGEHCKYCPVSAVCPKQLELARTQLELDFPETKAVLPDPAFLPLPQLEKIAMHKKQIEDWLGAVMRHLTLVAQGGTRLDNFELTTGRKGNRAWINETQAEAHLRAQGWATDDIKSLNSPAAIEKLVGKKNFPVQLVSQADGREQLHPRQSAKDFSNLLDEGPVS